MVRNIMRGVVWGVMVSALMVAGCDGTLVQVESAAKFGEAVRYGAGRTLKFPEFELQYTGEREERSERYPRGFRFQDFLVISASGTQTVSWSSGTGDIGPQLFTVEGEGYSLELQRSDRLGPLAENMLVVWKEE